MSAPSGTLGVEAGASGARLGMDGGGLRVALKAYAVLIPLIAIFDTENVLSALSDHARSGHPIPVWEPAISEASSGLADLAFAPVVFLAARWAPPRRERWLRSVLVHPPASAVFSSLHILGMVLIRIAVFAVLGMRYGGRLFDFVYEYPRDVPAYVIIAGLFWLFAALERKRAPPAPPAPATFDIKDGSRLIRAPVKDIVAVSSAGNYVEVILADGRRPLTRTTLAAAEAALGPHGFVRTHRSWLVNAAQVRELAPVGSGDFCLRLQGGAEAPLSRRFRSALESLRTR